MDFCVTGGSGFIGSHLCGRLLKDGHNVINVDNFCDFYPLEYKIDNVKRTLGVQHDVCDIESLKKIADKNPRYTICNVDIRDKASLDDMFASRHIDAVFHMAAMAGVRPSIEQPLLYNEVNVTGTLNILENMVKKGISKIVTASSSSVYGNCKEAPFREDMNVDRPISPYAATKKTVEVLSHVYHHLYGIDMALLRFFTVYGPGQRPDLAIHKFTRLMMEGSGITAFGDGSMERDYTYIDDIIDGTVKAMDHVNSGEGIYEVFNLGESRTVRLDELIMMLEKNIGVKAVVKWADEQPGDVKRTFADISKAKNILGYDPSTPIEKGLEIFVDWCGRYYGKDCHKENR